MLSTRFSPRILASTKVAVRSALSRTAALNSPPPSTAALVLLARSPYSSVTYSGGQPTEGQGGYYGSGGARVIDPNEFSNKDSRPEMLALAADVQFITSTMQEVQVLQHSLEREESSISPQAIELRQTIKKLMTSSQLSECLNRLEIQGSPVWGLSSEERELIIQARELVNEC